MDFDTILSDIGLTDRSDIFGGIDNEALDLGQFLENSTTNPVGANTTASQQISNIKSELLRPTVTAVAGTKCLNESNLGLTTISAHVSVTTTPITTPPSANSVTLSISQNASHLPESPPDSSSEPPYSPLQIQHGLTLTSRDNYGTNGGPLSGNLHDLQNLPATVGAQFTPPHQNQHQHHPFGNHHLNETNQLTNIAQGVRVKHESGLIINPTSLVPHSNQTQPLHQHHQHQHHHQHLYIGGGLPHHSNDTHIDMSGAVSQQGNNVQMLYSNANPLMNYDPPPYPAGLYPQLPDNAINNINCNGGLGEMPRVEFIGTERPRPSAPSTPVHNTRKRKMSTQLEYMDSPNIKPDPGLKISPLRSIEGNKRNDLISTPAHSNSASHSPAPSTIIHENSMDAPSNSSSTTNNNNDPNDPNGMSRCIVFAPFQGQQWHKLLDQNLQDLSILYYQIDADKGFNFSVSDDAFVCQKKNHFQITCHAKLQGEAKFVKTPSGLEKIKSFHLHFYGVKLDAPNQTIRVEQSQSDRSKKPFHPVPIDLQSHIESKITVGRLHFSETTNNNMRKKGRPNPDQRYFQLVVALHVHTASGNYPIVGQASERIIVRASNPGQFESDVDLCWQRGFTQDTIFHAGRVGINTDRPDESLVVHGNLRISGHIVQPSDSRVKQEIGKLDTSEQLRNVLKIRIVRYRYEPEFALHSGLRTSNGLNNEDDKLDDIGVIAQEVREVIPDAVHEAGSVVLANGNVIENLLLVNKDRILMENIGATQELGKVTESLDTRIVHLERRCVILVIVMAVCLLAVSTLYLVEHNKQKSHLKNLEEMQWLHLYSVYNMQTHDKETHNMTNHNKTTHLPWQSAPWANHTIDLLPPTIDIKESPKIDYKKPYVSHQNLQNHQHEITTTAPILRNNKASNKSKPKITAVNHNPHKLILNESLKKSGETDLSPRISPSETSAEKIVDSVPVTQGFENNSIDIEAQQVTKKPIIVNKVNIESNHLLGPLSSLQKSPDNPFIEDLSHHLNEHPALNDGPSNDSFKQTEQITIPSIAHNNGYSLSSTTTISQIDSNTLKALVPIKENVLTAVNKQLPENFQGNFSLAAPPTSNNSKGVFDNTLDNQEPAEFHDVNLQNITADHTQFDKVYKYVAKPALERRSASTESSISWTMLPPAYEEVFGEPEECSKQQRTKYCANTCQDEESRIKPLSLEIVHDLHDPKEPLDQVNQQNIDGEITYKSQEDLEDEIIENKAKIILPFEIGKSSHPTQALSKQIPDEQQPEEGEHLEINDHEISEEPLNEKKILTKIHEPEPSSLSSSALTNDCSKLTSFIKANSINRTFALDDICAYDEKLLQKTYLIPISPYLISETIELHLSSTKPLNWFLCDSKEFSKKPTLDEFLQQKKSHFIVDLPKQGSFEQQLHVRVTNETKTGNICSETPLATNTILQYNFKILRDCD